MGTTSLEDALTKAKENKSAREGIRFNAVAPGVVDSPMNKDVP